MKPVQKKALLKPTPKTPPPASKAMPATKPPPQEPKSKAPTRESDIENTPPWREKTKHGPSGSSREGGVPSCGAREGHLPSSGSREGQSSSSLDVHWAKGCFIIVLWRRSMVHILEAVMVGVALKKTCTRRRICFVDEDSVDLRSVLESIWEFRTFKHLDVNVTMQSGLLLPKVRGAACCPRFEWPLAAPGWNGCLLAKI